MATWEFIRQLGEAAISIFAIVNPIGGLPMFVSLTAEIDTAERRRLLRLAGAVAFGIISVMALAGQFLLQRVFHIGIAEFAFGGGLLLIVTGIRSILAGPQTRNAARIESGAEPDRLGLAVSPIASPLLAGPGSVVTVMLTVNQFGHLFALGACVTAFVFVILVLNYAHLAYRFMGRLGALAVGRVMQIFIVAIGVKFCFRSLAELLPALTK